jgi:hypothetical protein
MANFEGTTASNGAKINPRKAKAIMAIVEDYNFAGGDIDVMVEDNKLHIYGHAWLDVQKADNDEQWEDCIDEFLTRLAPLLKEPLIIQCIGAEKCRYPLSAMQVSVTPAGAIKYKGCFK